MDVAPLCPVAVSGMMTVRSGSTLRTQRQRDTATLEHLVLRVLVGDRHEGVVVVVDAHRRLDLRALRHPGRQRPEGQLDALVIVIHVVLRGGERRNVFEVCPLLKVTLDGMV